MIVVNIFTNRHSELRVGWRLFLFVVLALACAWVSQVILHAVGLRDNFALNTLVLISVLLVSYLMTRFVNGKPFGAIGLSLHSRTFQELGIGCLLGFLMMTGIFLVELMGGYFQLSWRGSGVFQCVKNFLWAVPVFGVSALLEEVLFRGYVFQTLIQGITFLPATLVMAAVFGVGHVINPHSTSLGLINVTLAGIFFSVAYMKTRSLWLPFGLHFAWNFSQTMLYGFPTSGLGFERFRVFDLTQEGPEWVTGGAFGPEGGVLATVSLAIGLWYILKSQYLRAPEGIITLDSVEDLVPAPEPMENQHI